jgi:hypothetical protein
MPIDRLPARDFVADCGCLFGNPDPEILGAVLSGADFHAGMLTPADPDFACNGNRDLHAGGAA